MPVFSRDSANVTARPIRRLASLSKGEDGRIRRRRDYSDRQVTTCDEVMKRENEVMTFEVLSHNELM